VRLLPSFVLNSGTQSSQFVARRAPGNLGNAPKRKGEMTRATRVARSVCRFLCSGVCPATLKGDSMTVVLFFPCNNFFKLFYFYRWQLYSAYNFVFMPKRNCLLKAKIMPIFETPWNMNLMVSFCAVEID
jgi:hypothetical protein